MFVLVITRSDKGEREIVKMKLKNKQENYLIVSMLVLLVSFDNPLPLEDLDSSLHR